MADEDRFPGSHQESIATVIALCDDDNSTVIANLVELDLFDPPYGDIVARCVEHRRAHKRPPGKGHIDDVFAHILEDKEHKQYRQYDTIINKMVQQAERIDTSYILTVVSDFIRIRKMRAGIVRAVETYQKGGPQVFEELEEVFRQNLKIRNQERDYGFSLADDRALGFLERDTRDFCNIGIKELDERGVVPTRREMLSFLAPQNRGKCLDADTMILLANGQRKRIEDVVRDKDPAVISFNKETRRFESAAVGGHWDNGRRDCLCVTTASGYSITTTKNHPLLTPTGWITVENLSTSDYVAVARNTSAIGSYEVQSERIRLLGYLISDAHFGYSSVVYSKNDIGVVSDVRRCVESLGDQLVKSNKREGLYRITGNPKWNQNNTHAWLRNLGFGGEIQSCNKKVPSFIFTLTDRLIIEFLTGLFSGGAAIYHDRSNPIFQYCSASSHLVKDVRHLLLRLGISSTLKYFSARLNGRKIPGYARLDIKRKEDISRLIDTIALTRSDLSKVQYVRSLCEGRQHSRHKTKYLSKYADFEKIKDIQYVGPRQTYDITVPVHHNFVADDMIAHNSFFLTHCGKYGLMKGWKVIHYTLENSDDMTAQRYFQTIFNGVRHEGANRYTVFEETDNNAPPILRTETLIPEFVIDNQAKTTVYLSKKMEQWRSRLANLRVRRFPSGRLTFDMLEQDLDELMVVHKFQPDMLLVDMPQLMKMTRRGRDQQDYSALDELVTSLRGLAVERNLAIVVPQQGNRSSNQAKNVQAQHGSGSIGIFGIADNLITYSQTPSEEAHGLARLFLQKVRNDQARITILISQHYASGQFCMDSRIMTNAMRDKLKEFTGSSAGEEDEEDETEKERVRR